MHGPMLNLCFLPALFITIWKFSLLHSIYMVPDFVEFLKFSVIIQLPEKCLRHRHVRNPALGALCIQVPDLRLNLTPQLLLIFFSLQKLCACLSHFTFVPGNISTPPLILSLKYFLTLQNAYLGQP